MRYFRDSLRIVIVFFAEFVHDCLFELVVIGKHASSGISRIIEFRFNEKSMSNDNKVRSINDL